MRLLATLTAVAALATPAGYVQGQQRVDGGFGDAPLTAWATLGLVAAGKDTGRAAAAQLRLHGMEANGPAREAEPSSPLSSSGRCRPGDPLRGCAFIDR